MLDDFLKNTAKEITLEMEKFFPKKTDKSWLSNALGEPDYDFDEDAVQKALTDPIWDFLDRGGKRWRPVLMILACQAVGGTKEQAMPFTVIPELVHNGTIMIDDVEDNSYLRRGKKATHLLFGVDVAVNAANAMYYLPLVTLFNSNTLGAEKKAHIYDVYAREMLKLSIGQAIDIRWHNAQSNVNESQYLQMCSYKTGSLSRLAIQLGGILGGASQEQLNAFSGFGTSLGVAFQIQDDILNLKPDKEWGKEIGDDINEGKITLIIINALKSLKDNKKQKLLEILQKENNSKEEISEAISIIAESDAINYSKELAKNLVLENWANLEKVLDESDAKNLLKEFAYYVVNRKL